MRIADQLGSPQLRADTHIHYRFDQTRIFYWHHERTRLHFSDKVYHAMLKTGNCKSACRIRSASRRRGLDSWSAGAVSTPDAP